MQIFIIGSPLATAIALDSRRLNKQIIECRQILEAIHGRSQAWANHPCTRMYKAYPGWVYSYERSLEHYRRGNPTLAKAWSDEANKSRPPFHTESYFNQMKRRLYSKDNELYKQWSHFGESDVNWYYVDGEWLYYRNGKRITSSEG